ncbi:MAG: excinuclease ABC subunit UvrA, partial [bacterium]|nr:excinuclease ABC subunit UvrA [bacterium]
QVFLKRTALLKKLGLGYLSLDRESTTLSNGEAQRIRLASQIETGLRGILYVLDEPSAGLHQRDNKQLLDILHLLRDNGNTVIVVEHDEETIRNADHLIDIGPGPGIYGGEVLFCGAVEKLLKYDLTRQLASPAAASLKKSRTYAFLSGRETLEFPAKNRPQTGKFLQIMGAKKHNLKSIDVPFQLAALNVVTGVSGAGKSTLVHDILANCLKKHPHGAGTQPGENPIITGLEWVDKVVEIDQAPIGRTPRSNPATYTKLFDHIRDLFASLPESRRRKWDKGRFSFNVTGGRCETCEGAGLQQIGRHFLGTVEVICENCGGKRFN